MDKILYVGSEVMPFGATGGLGDVLGSLPIAVKRGSPSADVRVVMPLYSQVSDHWRAKMTFVGHMTVHLAWRAQYCGIFSLVKDDVTFYFLDNEYYFRREKLYGEYDDAERFAFFSVASLELMRRVNFYPDVLHANDWQSALSVILLRRHYAKDPLYSSIRTVYTIHNIEYQGVYGMKLLNDIFALTNEDAEVVHYNGALNLTKGAILCADSVTTVSPNYAKQIQTPAYSSGMHFILQEYSDKVSGIINGIDMAYYDPKTDPDLPFAYSARGLAGKAKNKAVMQEKFCLAVLPDTPVIAMITRLVSHKGLDLVLRVFDEIMTDDVQFILLGTGDHEYEEFFRNAATRYPKRVSVNLSYNRVLSKLIYAGSDIFLMPSKSEACGLSQMIASRYGSVPIVRETGGLYDTIKPYGPDRSGNGFTFASYNAHDMLYVIREAEGLYRDKANFQALVKKIMKIDFSWNTPAAEYTALYNQHMYNSTN